MTTAHSGLLLTVAQGIRNRIVTYSLGLTVCGRQAEKGAWPVSEVLLKQVCSLEPHCQDCSNEELPQIITPTRMLHSGTLISTQTVGGKSTNGIDTLVNM